ncbi:minor tail protein [Arthrobacter phage Eileen]|uniref:Uncharacterized protein n=2 Tax=Bridgettevirus TaxID=2733170 RepID=A0A3G2KI93_9CAUD|nr:minor tail protein [Arthrobacter phage Eileen]YP_009815578.1 minor tail protein [Arthrobacter phage Peas]AYN57817.1 hypothetical protein PBI_EILEEN_28 [Arthrobacter phage Eileen]AYN58715.1 hypothetical protein PBI_PEAS_28 [Arthrobacter phage Peas]
MTIVNIKVQVPANGAEVPAKGRLQWEPSRRRVAPDGALILPDGFPVKLVNGEAVVDVEPSTDAWAWRVTESFAGRPTKRRLLAVPAAGPVDYTELLEVDPATLDVTTVNVSPDPDHPGLYLIGA